MWKQLLLFFVLNVNQTQGHPWFSKNREHSMQHVLEQDNKPDSQCFIPSDQVYSEQHWVFSFNRIAHVLQSQMGHICTMQHFCLTKEAK